MKTNRSELVEGKKYYMDNKKDIIGVFKGRGEGSIYFDCGDQNRYETSTIREGLIMFEDDNGYTGFREVKLEDDLTDEALQALVTEEEKYIQQWRDNLTQEQINSI